MMNRTTIIVLTLLAGGLFAVSANAAVVTTSETAYGWEEEDNFAVNDGDLLQTDVVGAPVSDGLEPLYWPGGTVDSLTDGDNEGILREYRQGTLINAADETDYTVTWTLDTTEATLGWDLTQIDVYSGWDHIAASQWFQILVSTDGGQSFSEVATVQFDADTEFVHTTITDDAGVLASGVDAIRFSHLDDSGGEWHGGSYREIDILGSPTVPEPATLALLSLGGIGVVLRRRS